MNENQYRVLCHACDQALTANDATIERVAISWLHVVREHPVFLRDYEDVVGADGISILPTMRTVRHLLGFFSQLRPKVGGQSPWFCADTLPEHVDVLFVSHLVNSSHIDQATDFYYGRLPEDLVRCGYSVAIALINHTNLKSENLVPRVRPGLVPRIVLSGALGMTDEFSIFQRLRTESIRLKKAASREKSGLFQRVLMRAAQESLSGASRSTLRIGQQIHALVEKLRPNAVVVTHEGHGWERLAFSVARSAAPGVICIGYQHAALFRLQHAIRRRLGSSYNPDVILTAGSISQWQLESCPELEGMPISVLGSTRSIGDTLEANQSPPREWGEDSQKKTCLVIPEGIASECWLLFSFSAECARACPDVTFIWRLHPILSFELLRKMYPELRDLPENIKLSSSGLEDDAAHSRWTLYRGTTAIVQAVLAGSHPVYFQSQADEMTIDPLYAVNGGRTTISNVEDFQNLLSAELDLTTSEVEEVRKYCKLLFTPINSQILSELIPR